MSLFTGKTPMDGSLREYFLLDSQIHFLNHGSFGACPRPVFEVYQAWQRRLENQPVLFLGREITALDLEARTALARYVHTTTNNLVFITNATHGVNVIARSLALKPGDEIVSTNHEYGACDYAWEFVCQKTGATYIRQAIPLPVDSLEEMAELIWQSVTPRTKIIYLSHITSPTALRLPVELICARARQAGILTLVDGAHAPGQISLDLEAIAADWYVGNLHKWALSPKGAGFLYARPEVQPLVEPLIISWGYHIQPEFASGSQFVDYLSYTGTKDPAAILSVPAAIQFMQDHNWDLVRQNCHALLHQALQRICDLVQMEPLYPLDSNLYHQMGIAPLPLNTDLAALKARLYDEYRVEVPMIDWNGRKFVRVSVQGYNTPTDLDALCAGLQALIPVADISDKG